MIDIDFTKNYTDEEINAIIIEMEEEANPNNAILLECLKKGYQLSKSNIVQ